MTKIISNKSYVDIEIHENFFTNHNRYRRTHDLLNNKIYWTPGHYDVFMYEYSNNEWRLCDDRAKPFTNIPELEIIYQNLLRENKLKRIC